MSYRNLTLVFEEYNKYIYGTDLDPYKDDAIPVHEEFEEYLEMLHDESMEDDDYWKQYDDENYFE